VHWSVTPSALMVSRAEGENVFVLRWLDFCVDRGAYTGCEYSRDDSDIDRLMDSLSDLKLDGSTVFIYDLSLSIVEYSGTSVQHQGKIVTNEIFLVRHSNICVKLLFLDFR